MTLQSSGPITLADVNIELDYPATRPIALGDTYVVALNKGNHNLQSLYGQSNTKLSPTQIGSAFSFGGYNHGPSQTPNFALTSQAARPQNLSCTMSVITGGNNYTYFDVYNQTGLIQSNYTFPPTGQIGVRSWIFGFTDVIQPYATNTYWCLSHVTFDGDYNYMQADDSFNYFTFEFNSWAG